MKAKLLVGAIALAMIVAAMPSVLATGTITITNVFYTPNPAKPGDILHLSAKVNASAGVKTVIAYTCYSNPSVGYICGPPTTMTKTNANGTYEGDENSMNAMKVGNQYHINITVTDMNSSSQTYSIPPFMVSNGTGQPSDYLTQSDCQAAKFFWWDDACHAAAKTLSDYKDKASCEQAGHFWWDSKCNAERGTPDKYTDQSSCTNVTYYWYSNKCNANKQSKGKGFLPGFEGLLVFAALGSAGFAVLSRRKKN